jgi:branched-chain amino acid transport system ATP-binding protein
MNPASDSRSGDSRSGDSRSGGSPAGGSPATPVLELRDVQAGYGSATVLRGVSIAVPPSSIVALLGANGAGKTTVMRVASGLVAATGGQVLVDGGDVTACSPQDRTRRGLCLIPEGRGIFRSLTVRENLELFRPGRAAVRPSRAAGGGLDSVIDVFPVLGQRIGQVAGTMSGGEQQMLALARAFLASPRVVMVDEVSLGLAPKMVDQIFEVLTGLARRGVCLLVVEQYVRRALELADHVYLLSRGEVMLSGSTGDVSYQDVVGAYLA